MSTDNRTKEQKPQMTLVCDKCGEAIVIDLLVGATINPQCECGSRRFTVNPTEH